MTYVIAQPCVDVKDRACVDECPVDCIYEGERTLYINAEECVDCGATILQQVESMEHFIRTHCLKPMNILFMILIKS